MLRRTLPLAEHSAAELELGRPSWQSLVLMVEHEHVYALGKGFVQVTTRAGRGVPIFLASIVGPQLLTLSFKMHLGGSQRKWRAVYDGLCRAGSYALALRVLFADFDSVDRSALVRQANYLPVVTPIDSVWNVGQMQRSTAPCSQCGFHWVGPVPAALVTDPLLQIWKEQTVLFRDLQHDPLPQLSSGVLKAAMRALGDGALCVVLAWTHLAPHPLIKPQCVVIVPPLKEQELRRLQLGLRKDECVVLAFAHGDRLTGLDELLLDDLTVLDDPDAKHLCLTSR